MSSLRAMATPVAHLNTLPRAAARRSGKQVSGNANPFLTSFFSHHVFQACAKVIL